MIAPDGGAAGAVAQPKPNAFPQVPQDLAGGLSRARAWHVVAVMFFVYVAAVLDRQIITLLVGPMKRDLGLPDEQIGVVIGFAFAFSYAFFALPLGYLADRTSRKKVLAWGMVIWSIMTAACGLAKTYPALLLTRVGVGVGEAVVAPTGIPMVASAFPPEKRSLPISICLIGAALGSTLALVLGGYIVEQTQGLPPVDIPFLGSFFAWQSAFLIAAVIGLGALLLLLTVREPTRPSTRAEPLRLDEAARYFARRPLPYAAALVAPAIFTMVSWGLIAWMPAALQRSFAMDPKEIGLLVGAVAFPSALIGPLISGAVGQFAARRSKPQLLLTVSGFLALGSGALFALAVLAPTPLLCIGLFGAAKTLSAAISTTPLIAAQSMTPPEYRSQATALQSLFSSIIGIGCGPFVVGVLATRVVGEAHLGLAMLILAAVATPVGAGLMLIGRNAYGRQVSEIDNASPSR